MKSYPAELVYLRFFTAWEIEKTLSPHTTVLHMTVGTISRHFASFSRSSGHKLSGPLVKLWHLPIVKRTMASAMSKRLEGKTIVVTGASSGIGKSTAMEFARTSPSKLRLILTARRIDTLRQIAADINKEVGDGVRILPVKLDVSNPGEVKGFVESLPVEFRDIDILVNNA